MELQQGWVTSTSIEMGDESWTQELSRDEGEQLRRKSALIAINSTTLTNLTTMQFDTPWNIGAKIEKGKPRKAPKRMFPRGLKTVSRYVQATVKLLPGEITTTERDRLTTGGEKATSINYATKSVYNQETGRVEEIKVKEEHRAKDSDMWHKHRRGK